MNKTKWIKLLGMAAAIAAGLASLVAGNVVEGVGIIAAAFSSTTALSITKV